jgi:hypothetical protein
MKAMKAMKAMKTMTRKAMKAKKDMEEGNIYRRYVWEGEWTWTVSGLTKCDLVKDKNGNIKSKKLVENGKKNPWIAAILQARQELNRRGLQLKKGSLLYKKAISMYSNSRGADHHLCATQLARIC